MSGDWRDIKLLLAIADARSLRRAAPLVNLDAVTLGRRLTALEEAAGVKLFNRTPRGVMLTETGQALLKEARQVQHYADRFFDLLNRAGKRNPVIVRATNSMVSYVLAPLVARQPFGPARYALKALDGRELPPIRFVWDSPEPPDIQVVWVAPGTVPVGRADDAVRCVLKPKWTVFAGQTFLQENGREMKRWHDLVRFPLLSVHAYSYFPQQAAMGPWLDLTLGRAAMEADWTNALEGPAVNGGGMVVLPDFARTYSDHLLPVEIGDHPRFGLELWMAASAEALRSPQVRTTFDAIYDGLRALQNIKVPWLN